MRLIASFKDEQQASRFQGALERSDIQCLCDSAEDSNNKEIMYHVWVVKEEDIDQALDLYEAFEKDPSIFPAMPPKPINPTPSFSAPVYESAPSPLMKIRLRFPVTRWIILICVILFFWSSYQEGALKKISLAVVEYFGISPLNMHLIYDAPDVFNELYNFFIAHPDLKMEEIKQWPVATLNEFAVINNQPIWKGFYIILLDTSHAAAMLAAPWFIKISQGEVWRLWTPCVLHGNFLHILFNMLWLWLLGRLVEFKLGAGRYILGMLIIGVISNTAQYLMSGPLFLGYSGIISGLGGFIWLRQKVAPWEGYMIPKTTLLFLFVFIIGMVLLQIGVFFINKFHLGDFVLGGIGNTSHVVGLLCGMILAKIPAFYRLKT